MGPSGEIWVKNIFRNLVPFFMGEKYFQECGPIFMGEKYSQEFASIFFMGEKYFQEFGPKFMTCHMAELDQNF